MATEALAAAKAKLAELQESLEGCHRDLNNWRQRDMVRMDGSERQDRMHAQRGESLSSKIDKYGRQIAAQNELIAKLEAGA